MNSSNISRRDFLSASVASAAAVGAASLLSTASSSLLAADEPQKKLGFAFVGLGGYAMGQLMPKIGRCQFCKMVALVSGHPDKAKAQAEKYGVDPKNIYNYDNYDSIKDNPEIDVVYVVLPNGMHAEYTVRAFQAGKHVMCEKPMANTAAEAQQMIDAGKAAGKKLQIGYRMHFDAATSACIAALRRGDIGKLQMIDCATGFTIGDPTQWRLNKKLAGGGCLMDIGIYSLSAARYLSGEEPTEVFAHTFADTSDVHFKEVEQTCDFQLKFPSGVLASCLSSYNSNLNRYQIYGNRGRAVLDPGQSYTGVTFQLDRGRGLQTQTVTPVDHFSTEMDAFAKQIFGTGPAMSTGEEGLQDMKIIDAIYQSAQSGSAVKLV